MKISIMVYDKYPVCSIALSTIIKDKFPKSIVKKIDLIDDFFQVKYKDNFDLIILDLQDQLNVNSLLKQIRIVNINSKIIFFTDDLSFSPEMIYGIDNIQFLGKNSNINKILSILEFVSKNKVELSFINRKDKIKSLSSRELECATLLMNGYTVSQIAKKLSLALSTVSTLKSRIFKKTEVNNLVELTKLFYI